MGEVYEAQHNLSKKAVALKILFPHIGKDEAARQRFLREVSAPAQIGHEAIVEVYDAGFDPQDGALFVAMELLQGEPLRDRLMKGNVQLDLLLDWFEQILDPLAAAHATGIVHRDLKPENVFLMKKKNGAEIIKILDFGIARDLDSSQTNVTHTGIAMGTPHYMAPEQAMSAKGVTAAADVWALGVMLYEALAGRTPFDGETASAIVVHACTQMHAPLAHAAPHVPPPLAEFVDRCLQKDPQYRPHHAGQMLEELRQVRQRIGSVSGVAAAAAGGGMSTGVPATGAGMPGYAPHGSQPGYATGPAGTFGGPNPSYATPPPGYHTGQPSAGFGTNPSAPGGYLSSPGFGSPPSGPGFGAPGGYVEPKKGGGGLAIGVIAVVLIIGVVVVGGGIAAAVMLGGDDEDETPRNGTVQIQTDVPMSELYVDNVSQGTLVPNQEVQLRRGTHQLELREAGQVVASSSVTLNAGQRQTLVMNRTLAQNTIPQPNQFPINNNLPVNNVPGNVRTLTGQLRPGDATLRSGEYADTHYFDWQAGAVIQVDMVSTDFDTYLILKAPSGQQWDNDDRPGNGLNAGITHTLTESGRWQILATSLSPGMTGDYTLTVRAP